MGERTLGRISTAVIDYSPPYMRRQVPPLNSEFASLPLWVVGLLERFPVSACWCGDCGCTTTPAWHLHERWGFELEVLGLCSRCSGHWSISPAQIYHRLYFVPMYFFFSKNVRTAWNWTSIAQARCNLSLVCLQDLAHFILLSTV